MKAYAPYVSMFLCLTLTLLSVTWSRALVMVSAIRWIAANGSQRMVAHGLRVDAVIDQRAETERRGRIPVLAPPVFS